MVRHALSADAAPPGRSWRPGPSRFACRSVPPDPALTSHATPAAASYPPVEAWLARDGPEWDENKPDFPEFDGPVFLLGTCALVNAVCAWVCDTFVGGPTSGRPPGRWPPR